MAAKKQARMNADVSALLRANEPTEADARAAIAGWLSQDAYVSSRERGARETYRLQSTGKRAPWSAAAVRIFRGCDELHSVAHLPADKQAAWIKFRLAGGDPIRVDWYQIKKAAHTFHRHHRLLQLAVARVRTDTKDPVVLLHLALGYIADGWRPDEPCADVNGFIEDEERP